MASCSVNISKFEITSPKDNKIQLSDCTCQICLFIMIEPVTMPCGHELCRPCFEQNVNNVNRTCPMCRTRISAWGRKAARNNKLVNEKRWREIREAFPEKVQKRLEGKDDVYSSDEEGNGRWRSEIVLT